MVPLTLTWVSRNGTEQRIAAPAHNYVIPRLSPDGQRLAVGIEEAEAKSGFTIYPETP